MSAEKKPETNPAVLREARELAIAQLSEAFAHDVIDVEEFERRLTLAHRADSVSGVSHTVSDLLPSSASIEAVARPSASEGTRTAPASERAASERAAIVSAIESERAAIVSAIESERAAIVSMLTVDHVTAIFGGVERHGAWSLPRCLHVRAVMGGILLDFREALLSPGVTEIDIVAFMGGVQIIVPPTLSVEVSGTAVMGGFGHVERVPVQADPDRPILRIHGFALMGGVAIDTRLLGESEADAHRRRAHNRRELSAGHAFKRLPGSPKR